MGMLGKGLLLWPVCIGLRRELGAFIHKIYRKAVAYSLNPHWYRSDDVLNRSVGGRCQNMRRQWVSVAIFGTLAAASVVGSPAAGEESAARVSAPTAIQRTSLPSWGIRDEAAMVLVGSALIGLAAAVRRAA